VDGKTYEFDQDSMTNLDAMALEDVTGWGLRTFGEKLADGSGRALTFLVWLVRSRTEPGLKFDEVEFSLARLDLDEDEVAGSGKEDPSGMTSTGT
jgi:hypothetical protein